MLWDSEALVGASARGVWNSSRVTGRCVLRRAEGGKPARFYFCWVLRIIDVWLGPLVLFVNHTVSNPPATRSTDAQEHNKRMYILLNIIL